MLPIFAALGIALVAFGLLAYWTVVVTEGAYLGSSAVVRLYDRGASTYDDVKGFERLEEFLFIGRPLLDRLESSTGSDSVILDIATGTGRLPLALLDVPFFEGRVVGCDASLGMLVEAREKLQRFGSRVQLLHAPAAPLPFADESFGAVTLLEALEFFPDRVAALEEAVRVLAPGGWLLTTNRIGIEARLMPGRTDSPSDFEKRLSGLGLADVSTHRWQSYYDMVWGRKPGDPREHRPADAWHDSIECPSCSARRKWEPAGSRLVCSTCGQGLERQRGIWLF